MESIIILNNSRKTETLSQQLCEANVKVNRLSAYYKSQDTMANSFVILILIQGNHGVQSVIYWVENLAQK